MLAMQHPAVAACVPPLQGGSSRQPASRCPHDLQLRCRLLTSAVRLILCCVNRQNWFGPAVRRIVEGETKFSKIGNLAGANHMNGGTDLKAMDLQQLFLAMTEEVRGPFPEPIHLGHHKSSQVRII